MNKFDWFLDISHHQELSLTNIETLKDNGMVGLIIKACQNVYTDPELFKYVTMAKSAGIPFGFYAWCDPIYEIGPQVNHFVNLSNQYQPNFLVMDVEQYWSSWVEWNAKYVKKQKITLTTFTPSQLFAFYNGYYETLNKAQDKKIAVYSRVTFINSYCPKLPIVINKSDGYWNAQYFYYWTTFDKNKDKALSFDEMFAYINYLKPPANLPKGVTEWWAWQVFEVPLILNGKVHTLDLNIIPKENIPGWFDPVEPVQPIPAPELDQIRYTSSSDTVLLDVTIPAGKVFYILDIVQGNPFVSIEFDGKMYQAQKQEEWSKVK